MLQWTSNRICSAECFPLKNKQKKKNTVLQPAPKITGLCEIIPIQICLCTISDYVFFLISPLTGEKPFSCPHCNRAFADRSNLRAHLQTHSDVKKYQCKNCSKTFSRMSLLHKHEESGCCVAHWTGILFHHQKRKEKKKPPKKTTTLCCFFIFPNPGELSGNHIEGVCSQDFFFLFLFFIPTMSGPFHFRVRNSSLLTCFLFQTVFLWLQSVSSFVIPPTCAIHALFCMSRMFYTLSRCYL